MRVLLVSKIRAKASSDFFVSCRVFPCVLTPGISSIKPRYYFPLFL